MATNPWDDNNMVDLSDMVTGRSPFSKSFLAVTKQPIVRFQ